MTLRRVESLEELRPWRESWNDLLARSRLRSVFQTFEWLESWWESLGRGSHMVVLLDEEDGTLRAAAPLVQVRRLHLGRRLVFWTFAGGMPTDYCDMLYDSPAGLERLVVAMRNDRQWDALDLDRIPQDSMTPSVLERVLPRRRRARSDSDPCPAYVFDPGHDGSELLAKKSVRRHENALRRAGRVEVQHLTRAHDVRERLEVLFAQHIGRRAVAGDASHFQDPRFCDFYYRLTEGLAARGWLLMTLVLLDDSPVAIHFGFVYDRKLVWYKPAFSTAHATLSPGETLLAELVRYCRAHDLSELDFTIGNHAFKERFATLTRRNQRFRIFRNRTRHEADLLLRKLKSEARPALRTLQSVLTPSRRTR
jgi:CelD/BcsL family acetyltransferase involved in cellulose biosynthesis